MMHVNKNIASLKKMKSLNNVIVLLADHSQSNNGKNSSQLQRTQSLTIQYKIKGWALGRGMTYCLNHN